VEAVHALIDEWGEDGDEDARQFRIQLNAFVRPGTVPPALPEDES
jgi:hypothetical protein